MGATSGLYRNSKYVRNIRRIILRNRLNSRCLFLWNKGLELLDASIGSLFFFFQPIVGSLLGWLLLNETLNSNFLLVVFLLYVAFSLLLLKRNKSRQRFLVSACSHMDLGRENQYKSVYYFALHYVHL